MRKSTIFANMTLVSTRKDMLESCGGFYNFSIIIRKPICSQHKFVLRTFLSDAVVFNHCIAGYREYVQEVVGMLFPRTLHNSDTFAIEIYSHSEII